jgi:hypothetical protein
MIGTTMPEKLQFISLTFRGKRFDDHGLDIASLQTLLRLRDLLLRLAQSEWLSRHPQRQRVFRRFNESFDLKLYELVPSRSTTVPLFLEPHPSPSLQGFAPPIEELAASRDLILQAIRSLDDGDFGGRVHDQTAGFISTLVELGVGLSEGESCSLVDLMMEENASCRVAIPIAHNR